MSIFILFSCLYIKSGNSNDGIGFNFHALFILVGIQARKQKDYINPENNYGIFYLPYHLIQVLNLKLYEK